LIPPFQLSNILAEGPGPKGSTSQFEHDMVQLIMGAMDNAEAIGTVEDAAHAGELLLCMS
jgi:hypothetical protein